MNKAVFCLMADKNTEFHQNNLPIGMHAFTSFKKKSITAAGQLIDFECPKIMGIINITPDSFYQGSRIHSLQQAIKTAEQMLTEGASFLDLGAYSTRPGASDISIDEELKRLLPIVKALVKEFPKAILSVDTFRSHVAEAAVGEGTGIINDISAGDLDPLMIETVARLKVPYIFMHTKGTPQNMKQLARYDDVVTEVFQYLQSKVKQVQNAGITNCILDPGFGFAKTIEHNYELLNKLEIFQEIGAPVLVGLSRKSMIWKVLEIDNKDALNGTTVLNTIALIKGANILRVHDVKPAVEVVSLVQKMMIN